MQSTTRLWILSTLSLSLLFFLLSCFAFIGIVGLFLPRFAAESIPLKVMLRHEVTEPQVKKILLYLQQKPYFRKIEYISSEEGLRKLGLDSSFLAIMDYNNPIPPSIDIYLAHEVVTTERIHQISEEIIQFEEVYEVNFPIVLIQSIEEKKGFFIQILGISIVVFLVIIFWLVYNTTRLHFHSRRLTIRTMQLVGASSGFIRRPFLFRAFFQGLIAGILADFILFLLLTYLDRYVIPLEPLMKQNEIHLLFWIIPLLSVGMNLIATAITINKYLYRSLDEIM